MPRWGMISPSRRKLVLLVFGECNGLGDEFHFRPLELVWSIWIHPIVKAIVKDRLDHRRTRRSIGAAWANPNGFLSEDRIVVFLIKAQERRLANIRCRAVVPCIGILRIVKRYKPVAFSGKVILEIIFVHPEGQTPLFDIAKARDRLRLSFRFRQSRQQQGCQNRDNRNHHQQFDERKRRPAGAAMRSHIPIRFLMATVRFMNVRVEPRVTN